MSEDWEPASTCPNCSHPLDDHEMQFGSTDGDAIVALTCEVEDCECKTSWGGGRHLTDASFNQEAIEALGGRAEGERDD